jgi:hypothetical protein
MVLNVLELIEDRIASMRRGPHAKRDQENRSL